MTPTQLQAQWLRSHQLTKCKCAGYSANRRTKSILSTQTTSSTCVVVKSTKPTICKCTQVTLVNCQALKTQLEQEVAEFNSQYKQRRTDTVNAMLAIFGE